mmetsp:Transcript_16632/g.49719  ORF Transcript_16632/g.49719 Transcript_16632/m.49719 type:complete len:200 (-) Transcript_16632:2894-3493(-)
MRMRTTPLCRATHAYHLTMGCIARAFAIISAHGHWKERAHALSRPCCSTASRLLPPHHVQHHCFEVALLVASLFFEASLLAASGTRSEIERPMVRPDAAAAAAATSASTGALPALPKGCVTRSWQAAARRRVIAIHGSSSRLAASARPPGSGCRQRTTNARAAGLTCGGKGSASAAPGTPRSAHCALPRANGVRPVSSS